MIVDLADMSQVPHVTEPLMLTFGASVHYRLAMAPEELRPLALRGMPQAEKRASPESCAAGTFGTRRAVRPRLRPGHGTQPRPRNGRSPDTDRFDRIMASHLIAVIQP